MTQDTEEVVARVKRMSAGATMMMGKTERDATVAAVQSLSDRIDVLEWALRGVAGAIRQGPDDAVSTWRNLANACQQHARAALHQEGIRP